jgi:O-6-methylguanine DNA methyltransferase
MKQGAYCLFETPLGWCGIAWREGEDSAVPPLVTILQLPEATRERTEARMAQRSGTVQPSAPAPRIAEVIEKVCLHLQGDLHDFRDVSVDLEGVGPFVRRVYEVVRVIPPGQTSTYGEVAKTCRRPSAARAVGQALRKNPIALIIPCHRVLAAGGKLGGFSAHGKRSTKAKMLAIEGVTC